jgi:uncharacterized protein (DUF488 family)
MKIYTIGFASKNAEAFFSLLKQHEIKRVIDIRLNPSGQLSGFAKKDDLPFFLSNLANDCQYISLPELAPTKEILKDYRTDSDWSRYVSRFETLMDERRIPEILNKTEFERFNSCLLCSEHSPEQCHRRLVAERLAKYWSEVEIIHL